jgi:F-type H+-transporting ATPase subunit delta
MLDKSLANRYAKALYAVASERGDIASVLDEVGGFVKLIDEDDRLKKFLVHPAIPAADKKKVLAETIGSSLSATSMNCISILLDAKRIGYLGLIHATAAARYNRDRNRVTARVASAFALDAALQQKIHERLSLFLGKDIDFECAVKPDLVGGITVAVDDAVIDGSVKRSLKKMEEKLALG